MNTQHSVANKILAIAFIGAASLVAPNTSHAAFTPVPVLSGPVGMPLSGPVGGIFTLLASSEVAFSDPNFPGVMPGLFRTVVLDNGLGGLDFYYQVVNQSVDTFDDIYRVEIAGYGTGQFTVDAAFSATLPVANPFSGSITPSVGQTSVYSADRVLNLPQFTDPVNFDFDATAGGPDEVQEGETSNWLVVRTNQTAFTPSYAGINGGSFALASTFAPIPEPSTVLFGLAMFGMCVGGRFRNKLAAKS
jgi:hypothetical protein